MNFDLIKRFVSESMRKNPMIGQFSKICTEKYTYTSSDSAFKNVTVTVDPGTSIVVPIAALHLDEKYFPSPHKFIPERFLENWEYNKYSYLPFGEGPRMCLGKQKLSSGVDHSEPDIQNQTFFSGMRFGLTLIKLGVSQVIKNFELSVNSKTKLPIQLDKWYILPNPVGGLWLDFHTIQQDS